MRWQLLIRHLKRISEGAFYLRESVSIYVMHTQCQGSFIVYQLRRTISLYFKFHLLNLVPHLILWVFATSGSIQRLRIPPYIILAMRQRRPSGKFQARGRTGQGMANPADRIGRINRRAHEMADGVGSALASGFHVLALFTIGATIVWAAAHEFFKMVSPGHASVEDIPRLFISLE